jgi:hypothetical protein
MGDAAPAPAPAADADAAAADAYLAAARRATPGSLPLLRLLLQRNVRGSCVARTHRHVCMRLRARVCALRCAVHV